MKFFVIILLFTFSLASIQADAQSSFSGDKLAQAIENYILNSCDGEAVVSFLSKVPDQRFKQSGITAKIHNNGLLQGAVNINMSFYDSEKLLKTINVPVRVNIYKDVLVAKNNIKIGESISSLHYDYQRIEVSKYKVNELIDNKAIQGKIARFSIPQGAVLTSNLFMEEKSIKKGDNITLIVRNGGLEIKSLGTALNDAAIGEKVRVKREGSSNLLNGTVEPNGDVLVLQ